jgi:hypothetical protein
LFSSSDYVFPFATSEVYFEDLPQVGDTVVLKPASAGWSGDQPIAVVDTIEQTGPDDCEVVLRADMPDADLHQSAVLDDWVRHRQAKR